MRETEIVTSTQNLLKRFAFAALAAVSLAGVAHAAEEGGMEPMNIRVDDVASLQRGSRLFFNYCSGCHSLQFMRYSRIAEDLKLDDKEVQASLIFTGARIGDKAACRSALRRARAVRRRSRSSRSRRRAGSAKRSTTRTSATSRRS